MMAGSPDDDVDHPHHHGPMNIHEDSFQREDTEAEEKEQRLNCYKNALNLCLQIVIFLWL